jgi:AcrR family transcriptional regulator
MVNDRTPAPQSREQRKRRTHDELLRAALLLLENDSFASLSLREVTRAAGVVPTAFYRHFASMEELGLALVDESFRTLRETLRSARSDPARSASVIRNSVEILADHVRANRLHFRFVARERYGGVSALRQAIRGELRLLASELATDLARFPYLESWTTEDLQMMAGLLVNAMVSTAQAMLDTPGEEAEIITTAEKQLRLIALGVPNWRPRDVVATALRPRA